MAIKSNSRCSKGSKHGVSSDTSTPKRVFGYIRVSTAKQDCGNQRFEILTWADEQKLTITEWVAEAISSRNGYKDRQLGTLLDRLQRGDALIVSEISRLGRSLTEVMTILHGTNATSRVSGECQTVSSGEQRRASFAFGIDRHLDAFPYVHTHL